MLFFKLLNGVIILETKIAEKEYKKDRKFLTLTEHEQIITKILAENLLNEICKIPTNEELKKINLPRDLVCRMFDTKAYFKYSKLDTLATL